MHPARENSASKDVTPAADEARAERSPGAEHDADRAAPFGADAETLAERVYEQLRAMAHRRMSSERAGHTLSATALAHEAYMRLRDGPLAAAGERGPFLAAAAEAMHRILIDYARARGALKRGGGARRVTLQDIGGVADLARRADPEEILSLDDAIQRLGEEDPRAAQVVRLRFFGGLTSDETALALGVSPATVKRDWEYARAWLVRTLRHE